MKRKLSMLLLVAIVAAAATLGLSGCNKVKGLLLKAPENILYDGAYVTWDKVKDAEYYTVQIDGGEAVRANSSTFAFDAKGGTFEATVASVVGEDSKSASVTFKPLASVQNVVIENDGTVSWDGVAGATSYRLSVNGTNLVQDVTDTRYADLPEGSSRVKVKPVVSGDLSFYSFWSQEVSVYIYSPPAGIRYDGADITWQGNAASYEVTVGGQTSVVRGSSMPFNSGNRDFQVSVKALGNYTNSYDSKTVAEDFYYLDTVKSLSVEDGILKWDPVDRAEGYKIRIDNVIQKEVISAAEYEKLTTGKSHDVQVMPVNTSGNYFSSWSAEKTLYILETPVVSWNNDLELDGEANNNLTWNSVNAANGYAVRVTKDGKEEIQTFSDVQRAFAYAYSDVGTYSVEVKATVAGGSSNYYDSKYCESFVIERLAAPNAAAQNFIVSDKNEISRGFTVNFVPVSGASEYQLYKDGVLLSGKRTTGSAITENNVVNASNISEQRISYAVRSMGSYNPAKRNVKLPCLSRDSLPFEITVQATPQNAEMSGFTLLWSAVSATNGFAVSFAGQTVTAQAESFDLSTLKAGSYAVSVCSRGNGSNVLPSNGSAPVNIQRLEAPANIKITADGNGTLQWNDVANAKSYQTFLDLESQALDAAAYGNMYQYIETNGTTLNMVAVANYYNQDRTLYYMSSEASPTQQFIRLANPEFPEGAIANSVELLWKAPSNINTAEYTPTYQIYSQRGEQIGGGDVNGTKFNIEYLEGGKSHTFLIKAIGNDSKYLDSDYSVVFTVFKLAKPVFTVQNRQYVWNGVANASSYIMEINGVKVSDEFHVSGGNYAYTPRYTQVGDQIVTLKAVGDGRNNADSAAFTYTQKTALLQTPVIDYRYSSDYFVAGGKIVVDVTTPSKNCAGYQYEIAGQSTTSLELSLEKVIQSPGTYTVRVKALGGSFDGNDVYYVDSQYAGGSASDKITLLAKPSGFTINSDGVIKWNDVQGRINYEYAISFDGGAFSDPLKTAYNSLNPIDGYKRYRTVTIKVRALGDGNRIVGSEWSEWTWTNANWQG